MSTNASTNVDVLSPVSTSTGDAVVRWLRSAIENLLRQIESTEMWGLLNSRATPPATAQGIMREIYRDIASYQPSVIQATIATIGQMPRSLDPRLLRSMLIHQADEFDHGEMAVRDFTGLGGNLNDLRTMRASPAAFAVAACWRQIEYQRDPFMYLGALYLFEGLTPIVTGKIKAALRDNGIPDDALEYIEFHSTEDIKHANLVDALVRTVAEKFPDSIEAMKHGFECFRHVYPLPIWLAAYERIKSTI